MPINFSSAQFIKSAPSARDLPADSGIEFAIMGRSNVGKSSTINALCQRKSLAITSRTPGRTQLLNAFQLGDIRLIDLPGFGYAKVSHSVKAAWHQQLDHYLNVRRSLKGVLLIIDARHPLQPFECDCINWAKQCEMPLHLIVNKCDKLNQSEKQKLINLLKKNADNFTYTLFSAVKKIGIKEVQGLIEQWVK